jgi:hypothetical protein
MIKSLTAENAHKLERVHELEAEITATAERNICEISMCQVCSNFQMNSKLQFSGEVLYHTLHM